MKTDCSKLYTFFKVGLGSYFTHPPGAHTSIVESRLVDMYFKGTDPVVKEKIVTNFTTPSCLRLLICTDAFRMGIDCFDVKMVIHYGVPGDVETYVQQVGRAGRDRPILLHSKRLMDNCESSIVSYVKNTRLCRRECLFASFENCKHSDINKGCNCCDICCTKCDCLKCVDKLSLHYSFIPNLFNFKK